LLKEIKKDIINGSRSHVYVLEEWILSKCPCYPKVAAFTIITIKILVVFSLK
jgi:hypothetical protein